METNRLKTAGLVVAGAVALGVAALKMFRGGEVEHPPDLTAEEVVEIFSELCGRMQISMARIMSRVKQLQAQMPDQQAQLAALILNEFEKQLAGCQDEVFLAKNADEEDVEHSTSYYLEHPEDPGHQPVKEAVNRLREIYSSYGGRVEAELPADLDVTKMCLVLGEYIEAYVEANERVMQTVQAAGGQLTDAQQEAMKMMIQQRTHAVFEKHGLTPMTFQAGCTKFQEDPVFRKKLAEVERQQHARQAAAAQFAG